MEATLQQALKSYWTGLLRQVLFGLGLSELWAELAALSLLRARGTARGTRDRRIDMGATSWPDPPRRLSPSGPEPDCYCAASPADAEIGAP